jgi:hypothetical protein
MCRLEAASDVSEKKEKRDPRVDRSCEILRKAQE